jgi:prevent-host-death family protein
MAEKRPPVESMPVSHFKATCLAVLERVRRTGRPVRITKRGELLAEVVPPSTAALGTDWIGALADTARITGDIVGPAADPGTWESTR